MQLNPKTIEIIKTTHPILKQQGVAVTEKMYDILFAQYPECEKLFVAAQSQPEKLANAILAFVSHIEHLDELASNLQKIAQKHVAAEVKAIHYPMVADALITAMREVIGRDVFNKQVTDAWVDAYTFLASHLMNLESDMYVRSYQTEQAV